MVAMLYVTYSVLASVVAVQALRFSLWNAVFALFTLTIVGWFKRRERQKLR